MVSLIITVLNERALLPQWLESIKKQTRQPDEIIIVDGGSTDGTWTWLEGIKEPNIRVFRETGNIAHGRNFAIREARGTIIAVTDAGCVYSPEWFSCLITPLEKGEADFVATAFGPWLTNTDSILILGIASVTIPASMEFKDDWLASSRSAAFPKRVWEAVGGYPEWIPYCEDVLFDLKVKKFNFKELYIREPLVFWRPRVTLGKYWRQLYNYTLSDGHAKLFFNRQLIRFAVYGAFALTILLSVYNWQFIFVPIFFGFFYVKKFYLRWLEFTRGRGIFLRIVGVGLVPSFLFFGDVAKMWGWLCGVSERKRGKVIFES